MIKPIIKHFILISNLFNVEKFCSEMTFLIGATKINIHYFKTSARIG